jgi:glycerol kinase
MSGYILAIDQGTTSSRAIVFDGAMKIVAQGQQEFPQIYPASGWVEHDPEDIWNSVVATVKTALRKAKLKAADITAIGITNQRETAVIWDRATGKAIHNAIVWQDRRTAPLCRKLKKRGLEPKFSRRTGLLLDPYFAGTKFAWLLDHVKGARARAAKGELAGGTIDTFLIWRLTGGRMHLTDATNASRTLLYDIGRNEWDEELLNILDVPIKILPQVKDCADDFGVTEKKLFGAEIPILGVAGDQQAATIGQASESGKLAATADPAQSLYLVPAFVGLGAPHWDADARGAVFGLTRNSGPAEFARAALESVAFQTRDLLDAMRKDWTGSAKTVLRVDGGMVVSDWTMQRLADILDAPVDRPEILETTALGAAWLAGSKAGVWPKESEFAKSWAVERRFTPQMDPKTRALRVKGWKDAVRRTKSAG